MISLNNIDRLKSITKAAFPFAAIVIFSYCFFSWSTSLYLVSIILLIASVFVPQYRKRYRATAIGTLVFTACVRIVFASEGRSLQMHTEDASSSRIVNRIFDESDLAYIGSQIARHAKIARPDGDKLGPAMQAAYSRMRHDQGLMPSPVLATYLGLQRAAQFDVLEFGDLHSRNGVIVFLHGWLGSFTLPCWQISQAAIPDQIATVCPSMSWKADWWSVEGQSIVEEVIQSLHKKGVSHIYLAGFSNGAVGALHYAQAHASDLKGLILISGAKREVKKISIPTLVIQGRYDQQFPPSIAREFSQDVAAQFVDLDAGHFAMLVNEPETNAAISKWLSERIR